MRTDDHMMTILTGLVLAIVLGVMAQKSDVLLGLFAEKQRIVARDDVFYVRAGASQTLDVLANDVVTGSDPVISIVDAPLCGSVGSQLDGIRITVPAACDGIQSFSYCLQGAGGCDVAKVSLNIRPLDVVRPIQGMDPKIDLVALPETGISKAAPAMVLEPVAATGDEDAISAYVATVGADGAPAMPSGLQGVAAFLIDTSLLDLTEIEVGASIAPIGFSALDVPLDPLRSAGFRRSYADTQTASDPARELDASATSVTAGVWQPGEDAQTPSTAVSAQDHTLERTVAGSLGAISGPSDTVLPKRPAGDPDPFPSAGRQAPDGLSPGASIQVAAAELSFGLAPIGASTARLPLAMWMADARPPDPAFEPSPSLAPRDLRARAWVPKDTDVPGMVHVDAGKCDARFDVEARAGARLRVRADADCLAGQDVTIRQQGIAFAFRISDDGFLVADIPALAEEPVLDVEIGALATRLTPTVEIGDYFRVARTVVVMDAASSFHLQVAELDPTTGKERVATAQNAITHRDAALLGRGYVTAFDAGEGKRIEVYSLPLSPRVRSRSVDLRLAGAVASDRCKSTEFISYLHAGSRAARLQSAEFKLPACGAFVKLSISPIIGDMRLAAR